MEEKTLEELQAEIDAKNKEIQEEQESKALTVQEMSFGEVVENAKKSNLLATANDKDFVSNLSEMNKDVLKASIELERERVEKSKQEVLLEKEKLDTEREKELNDRLKDRFGAKLDAQEYHFKSLQPILETFGIKKPMNVWVMWAIAIIGCITLIYPTKLLFCATFGNLIAGATSDSRKGFAKGCLWTAVSILGLALTALIVFGIVKVAQIIF